MGLPKGSGPNVAVNVIGWPTRAGLAEAPSEALGVDFFTARVIEFDDVPQSKNQAHVWQ
jgi:hypothetical protein